MARISTKIGDVFSVKVDENNKKYFQLITFDLTQLNSDVIRAFKKAYPIDITPDLSEIVDGEIEFYAHCVTKWGMKMNLLCRFFPPIVIMKCFIVTNASMIRMFTRIAVSLLRTVESIATPCSVKAYERTVECFKLLNQSQFATSLPFS